MSEQPNQSADKLYNIGSISEATFINYPDGRKLNHHLTSPPFLSEVFVGRKEDIQHIHERLFSAEGHLLLLVNGEGGIGKTTLAARYYHEHCHEYQHVAWVLSERSIALAVLMLAAPLGVGFEDTMDTEERFQVLLTVLANLPKPCLLVVDNANELEDLETYYPQLQRCTNFHVLFTTRVNEYAAAAFYKIPPLPMDLALLAFREHYKAFESAEEPVFRELYEAVNGNTLVLELFAKNLHHFNTKLKKRYLLTDLRQDVEKNLLRLSSSEAVSIRYQAKGGQRKAKPEEVIAAMYDLSALPDEEQALLSVLAVLPAERIPYDLLERLLAQETAARFADMDRHLLSLAQKGWLDYSDTGNSFKISPVIQEVSKAKNAERLLDDCRSLVNTLLTGLDEDNRHQDNYQQAAVFARLGEAVIFSIPTPNINLSVLCQNIGNYHKDTGNLSRMMQAYQKMLDILSTFCAAEPDHADFKNRLAISYAKLGETHSALGDLQQALTYFEDYNRLEKELHEAFPQNVGFKKGLGWANQFLGITHTSLGNLDDALIYFEQMSHLFKELHEAFPQNVEYKNGLAISYSRLGGTHSALGDLQQALRYFEKDIELSKELHEAFPQNVEYKNGLAISFSTLGETHRALGDLQQALTYFEEYNRLKKELYEAFPQNVGFKNGLAISYSKFGETHSALGDLQQALTYFEEYNRLKKELYEAFPQNVGFKNGLAISYSKFGETHSALGDLQQALTYFEQYNRLEKELHEVFPQNVGFKNRLAISFSTLGETHRALGDLQQALRHFEECNRLSKELYEAFPQNVTFKNGLANSYGQLGTAHVELSNLDIALQFFETTNQLFKELHEAFPQNVEFKNGLAISYSKLGEAHSALGDLQQALRYFEEYNRLKKELHEAFPQNVGFKNGLAISYSRLGGTHSALGDLQQALRYCEDSNRLGKELHETFPENVNFKSNYAESLAVLFAANKIFSLSVETTYLDKAIQLFQELYSSSPRPYYQQKINICLQMKRADADLKQLISEMISF